jgi:hypothetical protein
MNVSAVQLRIGALVARSRKLPHRKASHRLAVQIRHAASDRERARLVLCLSDALAVEHCADLRAACLEAGFPAGACFIDIRVLAARAVRTPDGRMPAELAERVEYWRRGMAALAGGVS